MSFFKGAAGLIAAVGVISILLVELPAYRWFFLISLGIGIVVAVILSLWNKHRPVRAEDVDRRPLKLD